MDSVDELLQSFNRIKRESTVKYLDWEKAKRLCLEHPDCSIWAGIGEDMGNTGGEIFDHGKWCADSYVYDRSFWGTPVIEVYHDDSFDEIQIPCWTTEEHECTGIPTWWGTV